MMWLRPGLGMNLCRKNKPTHDETLAMREKERQAREARYANATDVEDILF